MTNSVSTVLLIDRCQTICDEVERFYLEVENELGSYAFGYKVLYGPPVPRPPVLFVGFQPGGGVEAANDGRCRSGKPYWPDQNEFTDADWSLARHMRRIWSPTLLIKCVTANSVFFRAPSKRVWSEVPRGLRYRLEAFSRRKLSEITELICPEMIVAVGLGHLVDFQHSGDPLISRGRRLAQPGYIGTIPAVEIIHLSGARLSNDDRDRLKAWIETNVTAKICSNPL